MLFIFYLFCLYKARSEKSFGKLIRQNAKVLEKLDSLYKAFDGRLSKIEKLLENNDESINLDDKVVRMVIILANLRYMNFATFYKPVNLSKI